MTSVEAMKQRKSIRTYLEKALDEELLQKIGQIIGEAEKNLPMGTKVKFGYIPHNESNDGMKIGTYGVIKNQQGYIYGIAEKTVDGYLDFSYGLQKIITDLTKLGLGTVWLGGTYNKKGLFKEIPLKEGETIPAITPVGFPSEKLRFSDKISHFISGSKNRKPWDDLFFKDDFTSVLTKENVMELFLAFDMVRIGPSSVNGQTWRLIKDGNKIHFYNSINSLSFNNEYLRLYQTLDIGIAMYQFEESVKELGLCGKFIKDDPKIKTPNSYYSYFSTYRMNNE